MTSRFAVHADGRSAAVIALGVSLALPVRGGAQSLDPVELSWDAPAGCPTAADVRARVHALAGPSSFTGLPLRAAATVTRIKGGSTLQLKLIVQMNGLFSERSLEARACEDLAGAAAINLALLLNDAQQRPASAASPTQSAASPELVPPQPQPQPAQARSDPDASEPSVRAVVQGPLLSGSFGPMPAPSFGVSLAGGVASGPWSLVAKATLWLPHTVASERTDAGAKVDRIAASLHVCRAFPFARVALAWCSGLSIEQLWARGVGRYVRAESADATWLAVGVGAQARFQLVSWLNLLGQIELKLHAARPQLSITGVGRVSELGMLSGELSLGTEWIL